MAEIIANVYGDALYELAAEEHRTKEFLQDAEKILQVLDKHSEFDKLMNHPGIPKSEKEEMIKSVFEVYISKEMTAFLRLLINKERYEGIRKIIYYFIKRVWEEQGIGEAFVTTAVELKQIQKEAVMNKLLATTSYRIMELHYNVDPSMIGGMIIRIKDRVVDSSIRTKLFQMRKQLLGAQVD